MLMNLAFVYDLCSQQFSGLSFVFVQGVFFPGRKCLFSCNQIYQFFFFFCSLWSLSHSKAGLAHAQIIKFSSMCMRVCIKLFQRANQQSVRAWKADSGVELTRLLALASSLTCSVISGDIFRWVVNACIRGLAMTSSAAAQGDALGLVADGCPYRVIVSSKFHDSGRGDRSPLSLSQRRPQPKSGLC